MTEMRWSKDAYLFKFHRTRRNLLPRDLISFFAPVTLGNLNDTLLSEQKNEHYTYDKR